jgi:5-methyltetrahydrofolate--homocysteine methyltransferase
MADDILVALDQGDLIIGDGAMGTLLDAQDLGEAPMPEVWNLRRPDAVQQAHRAYIEAGARMVTTNTIGGNRRRLADAGLEAETVAINRAAAEAAHRAAGDVAWVAGSVGPTGQFLQPLGPLTVAEVEAIYAEQVEALAEGGVDLILVETHYDMAEACAAIRVARQRTKLPVFATFAFDARGRTMMGLTAAEAARCARDEGATVVGANCGDGPEAITAGLKGMQGVTARPLMAQANAGVPRVTQAMAVWDVPPEQMVTHARAWCDLGARIIGGCCGTTPAHIAALAVALCVA